MCVYHRDDPSEFRYEDDKDSNDEDNSGNEYPDEDEEDDGDYEVILETYF